MDTNSSIVITRQKRGGGRWKRVNGINGDRRLDFGW